MLISAVSKSCKIEQRLLICCLETRDPKIRRKILLETKPDDFATEEARNIRRHMEKLLRAGKPLGRAEDMAFDAAVVTKYKETAFILALPEVRQACRQYSTDQVEDLLNHFHAFARRRILAEGIMKATEILISEASVEEVVGQTMATLEDLHERIKATYGSDPNEWSDSDWSCDESEDSGWDPGSI